MLAFPLLTAVRRIARRRPNGLSPSGFLPIGAALMGLLLSALAGTAAAEHNPEGPAGEAAEVAANGAANVSADATAQAAGDVNSQHATPDPAKASSAALLRPDKASEPPPTPPTSPQRSPSDAAAELVDAPSVSAKEHAVKTCRLPLEDEFFGLEWARRTSFRSVCVATHWLDGLFGAQAFDPHEGQINGHIAFVAEKREGERWDLVPRVRASIRLPSAERKFDLFFDRDKESQTIGGQTDTLHPDAPGSGEADTSQAGIGYQMYRGEKDQLNLRLGIRMRSWKPELFLRNRYQIVFADSGTDRWKFDQTVFWKRGEGLGETSNLAYERHLGGPFLLRWANGATFSETSVGVRWQSTASIFHSLSDDRALQWSYGGNGETRKAERVANHGPRVSYRQRMQRQWLFFEAFLGVDQIKDDSMPVREVKRYMGLKLEAHFNPP